MGFFQQTNFGPAMVSVGQDVAQAGLLAQRGTQDMAELDRRMAARLVELERRLTAGGTRTSPWGRADLTDEQFAALAGITEPEFREGRRYQKQGPQFEDAGYGPGERAEGAPVQQVETQGSVRGRRAAGAARHGIIAGTISPQHLKEFEQGVTERTTREDVYGGGDTREAARRAGAVAGKPMTDVKEDTRFDPYAETGEPTSTPLGRAKEKTEAARAGAERGREAAWRAEAGKDIRTDPNRPRGGRSAKDLSDDQLQKALESQRKVVADLRKDLTRGAKERMAEEVQRLDVLQHEQDQRLGLRPAPRPTPTPSPPPATNRLRFDREGNLVR
jgi:hypothetical protein